MIHYIEGKPHQNIELRTTRKRTVREQLHHNHAIALLRDTLARVAITLAGAAIIGGAYIIGTM